MQFRLATLADVQTLAELNERLIRDETHRNSMSRSELAGRMQQWLTNEYHAVLFERDDEILGYSLFRIDPEYVYLRQFYVEPAHRRQGIGRAAVEHLTSNFWQDRSRVRLEVLVHNQQAIAFWHSLGFTDYCIALERAI